MQMTSRSFYGFLLAAGLTLVLPSAVPAQAPAAGRNTAMLEARKRITEANEIVTQLRNEQKRVKEKLVNDFSGKEEWKNTVPNHKKATSAYEQARTQAMRAMQAKPEYKQLLKDRDALRMKLDAMERKRGADPDAITKVATELTLKGTALKKMELEAMETDEKALAAKDKLDAAQKEMDALDQEVETALLSDPDYAAIQQQLDQAEVQLVAAKDAAKQMQAAEAQARKSARPPPAAKAPRAPRSRRGGGGDDY